jgi:Lrp/AsnC family leucine-responsive transcriptional regulator
MDTKRDENGISTQETSGRIRGAEPDELDLSMLRFLEQHGRATNYEVGEAVGLSGSAASRRIQALESSGMLRGYRAVVDARLLGKRKTV